MIETEQGRRRKKKENMFEDSPVTSSVEIKFSHRRHGISDDDCAPAALQRRLACGTRPLAELITTLVCRNLRFDQLLQCGQARH